MRKWVVVFVGVLFFLPGFGQEFKPDLYIVCIGVSQYAHYPEKNLQYPAQDAAAVARQFGQSKAYAKVVSISLVDSGATRAAILGVRERLRGATVDDQVVLFFSGHGYMDPGKGTFYFCPHTFLLEKADSTGVNFDELEALVAGCPARRKLLLIDACYSGDVDPIVFQRGSAGVDRAIKPPGSKPFTALKARGGSQQTMESVKDIFVDVRRRTGATILASSGGLGLSYETKDWKSGFFTYAVVSSLTPNVTVHAFTEAVVGKVRQLTGGKQVPDLREDGEVDYVLW